MSIYKVQIATDRGDNRPHWMVQDSDDNITWGNEVHQVGDSLNDRSTCGNGVTTFAHRPCAFENSAAATAFLATRLTAMPYQTTKRYIKFTVLSVGTCLHRAPVEQLFQGINSQWDAIEFFGTVNGTSFPQGSPAPGQLVGGESFASRNAAFWPLPPSTSDLALTPQQCDNGGECGRCLMALRPEECPAYTSGDFGCSAGTACPAYVQCTHTTEGQICQPPNNAHCGIGSAGGNDRPLYSGTRITPNCGGMYVLRRRNIPCCIIPSHTFRPSPPHLVKLRFLFRNAQTFTSPPNPPSPPSSPPPATFISHPRYCATTGYKFTRGRTDAADGGSLIEGGITSADYATLFNNWRNQGTRLSGVSVDQCEAHCTAQWPCVGFNFEFGTDMTTGSCDFYSRIEAPMLDLYRTWQEWAAHTPAAQQSSTEVTYFNSRHEEPPCMATAYPPLEMMWCTGAFRDASGSSHRRVNFDGGCGHWHHAYMARGVRHSQCSKRHCADECQRDPNCVGFDITGDYGECWTRSAIAVNTPGQPAGDGNTYVNYRAVQWGQIPADACRFISRIQPPSPPSPPGPPPSPPTPPAAPPPPFPPPVPFTFYSQSLTFWDAEAFCVANGGHLASLHSPTAVALVHRLRQSHDSWIGLSRSSLNSPFTWTDGSTCASAGLILRPLGFCFACLTLLPSVA
jgi:hypothetical protein